MRDPVRVVTGADVHRVAESLAYAFDDDPVMEYLLPNVDSRLQRLIRF